MLIHHSPVKFSYASRMGWSATPTTKPRFLAARGFNSRSWNES